ncbi:MAG: GNAT family N-acetyltransferase [Myxococcota bacterium]
MTHLDTPLETPTALDARTTTALRKMWNAEFPVGIGHADDASLERYFESLENRLHYVVRARDTQLAGWLATFDRSEERWFAMIVAREHQRAGLGSQLLRAAQQENVESLSGWAVDSDRFRREDGSVYPSPLRFYASHGFIACPEERFESEVLSTVRIRWSRGPRRT